MTALDTQAIKLGFLPKVENNFGKNSDLIRSLWRGDADSEAQAQGEKVSAKSTSRSAKTSTEEFWQILNS